jgi:hypothetical protein
MARWLHDLCIGLPLRESRDFHTRFHRATQLRTCFSTALAAAHRQVRLSHLNDHLPKMLTRLEVFVSLDRFVEPENPIYHRLNPGNIHEAH